MSKTDFGKRRAADLLEAAKVSRDPLAVASMLGEVRSICLEVADAIDEFANPSPEALGATLGRQGAR